MENINLNSQEEFGRTEFIEKLQASLDKSRAVRNEVRDFLEKNKDKNSDEPLNNIVTNSKKDPELRKELLRLSELLGPVKNNLNMFSDASKISDNKYTIADVEEVSKNFEEADQKLADQLAKIKENFETVPM